jgi:hypothetical protein
MNEYVSYIDAKQARDIHQYKNIKQKLLKTNVAICFNITHTLLVLEVQDVP